MRGVVDRGRKKRLWEAAAMSIDAAIPRWIRGGRSRETGEMGGAWHVEE